MKARRQPVAASIQKIPDSVVKSVSTARYGQEPVCQAKRSVIDQFEVSVTYITDKQMLVFNCTRIFNLL
jgi:hypothetical protein